MMNVQNQVEAMQGKLRAAEAALREHEPALADFHVRTLCVFGFGRMCGHAG